MSIETKFTSYDIVEFTNSPIYIVAKALRYDNSFKTSLLQTKFKNLSEKTVKSLDVKVLLKDINGEIIDELDHNFLDIVQDNYNCFGSDKPIVLKNQAIFDFDIVLTNVAFQDGESISFSDVNYTTFKNELFNKDIPAELALEFSTATSSQTNNALQIGDNFWRCTCGEVNDINHTNCVKCDANRDVLEKHYNVELLTQIKDERLENLRLEEEKKAQEKAEIKQKMKSLLKKVLIGAIAIALLCGVIFAGKAIFDHLKEKKQFKSICTDWFLSSVDADVKDTSSVAYIPSDEINNAVSDVCEKIQKLQQSYVAKPTLDYSAVQVAAINNLDSNITISIDKDMNYKISGASGIEESGTLKEYSFEDYKQFVSSDYNEWKVFDLHDIYTKKYNGYVDSSNEEQYMKDVCEVFQKQMMTIYHTKNKYNPITIVWFWGLHFGDDNKVTDFNVDEFTLSYNNMTFKTKNTVQVESENVDFSKLKWNKEIEAIEYTEVLKNCDKCDSKKALVKVVAGDEFCHLCINCLQELPKDIKKKK